MEEERVLFCRRVVCNVTPKTPWVSDPPPPTSRPGGSRRVPVSGSTSPLRIRPRPDGRVTAPEGASGPGGSPVTGMASSPRRGGDQGVSLLPFVGSGNDEERVEGRVWSPMDSGRSMVS